jgi:diaminohydroxyphosphoribosylaminopyrimidine deaminase/5-amino-6-(5-phosphoribosylamino)uracil reductase
VLAAAAHNARIDLGGLMRECGRRGWCRVLIEGGANLAGAALSAGIVDRVAFFVAPKILGEGRSAIDGMKSRRVRDALRLADLSARPVGDDWLLEGRVVARRGRTG